MPLPRLRLPRGRLLLPALALSALSPVCGLQAQTLLSHYTLDGTTADAGSVNASGTLNGSATFGTTGSGVGGFDQALVTGQAGAGNYFSANTANNAAFGLGAITIALWVNITSGATNDRFVSNVTSSSGFDFFMTSYSAGTGAGGADTFRPLFTVNTPNGGVVSTSAKYITGKWLFLAVTYTSATGAVNFYSGDETEAVTLNTTASLSGSPSISASSSPLEIGGTPFTGSDRSPDARFNDVRIYNGVLSEVQLESLRAGVLAVPEPATGAFLAGVLTLGFGIAARRRR